MKRKLLLIFALIWIGYASYSATFNPKIEKMKIMKQPPDFAKLWAQVDSLEKKGLPQSALVIVEQIFNLAKEKNNSDQLIKSVVFKIKYFNTTEENGFLTMISTVDSMAKTCSFPDNAVMHSILADLYWMFYQNNYWKFSDRSATQDFDPVDIETWDLQRLANVIIHHQMEALKEKDKLQKTKYREIYKEILTLGNKSINTRPTLYDFLAHKAIDHFANSTLSLPQPADKFQISDPFYFESAATFVKENITTLDTLSYQYYAIRLMQELTEFRLSYPTEKEALLDLEIKRINWVFAHSVYPEKNSLYLSALKRMAEVYDAVVGVDEVHHLIAKYYFDQSSKYDFKSIETYNYKDFKKKAHAICTETIKKYPNTVGGALCEQLKYTIESLTLSFKIENNLLPNERSAISLSYKNIKKVYVRVASIGVEKVETLTEKKYGKEFYDELLKTAKSVWDSTYEIPFDENYNTQTTELLIDGLKSGHYVVFVSNNASFKYNQALSLYDFVLSTNLSYIQRKLAHGAMNLAILERKSGFPVEGANVEVFYRKYNYVISKYKNIKLGDFKTDANGMITVEPKHNDDYSERYLMFKATKDGQWVSSPSTYYLYPQDTGKSYSDAVYFFTDRAIYRPGQTVHFKGVYLKNNGLVPETYKKASVYVQLTDANYQKVSDATFTTNDYGTFSGSFEIPLGRLNGQYSLTTAHGTKYIRVEEYKRPKFSTEFLPFEGNYRLNDEVSVKGVAKAYAGPSLTDAVVNYRVVRTPLWRGWWYYRVDNTQMEITNGKTTTNEKGEYEIKFKAIPDLSMSQNDNLVFNYTIYADVTDINGETQSTSKSMVVGRKSLVFDVNINDDINRDRFEKLVIQSQNLNGEKLNAKGSLKVYALEENKDLLRERFWEEPDAFSITKEEWNKLYPGNLYKNEHDILSKKRAEVVFEVNFDTEKSKDVLWKDLKNWKLGNYVLVIESKDAFNQDVKYEKYFSVYSASGNQLPELKYAWFKPVVITAEPGEKAVFQIGSSAQNVKVLYEVEHQSKIVLRKWIDLNKECKLVEIPILESYRGNVSVHFSFVKENRKYLNTSTVFVPWSNKELDISFGTFRDKLYPGQDEEWIIKIKGPRGEKVAAEMLATLYDASLDAFVKQSWDFNIYNSYYASLGWNTQDFDISTATLISEGLDKYIPVPYIYYDAFNWFGFYYGSYYYYAASGTAEYADDFDGTIVTKSVGGVGRAKKSDKRKDEEEESKEITGNDGPPPPAPALAEISTIAVDPQAEEKVPAKEEKIRTNFNETAFFYPQLETNAEGEVLVKFKIPESLTKWKMMGFAQTKDLSYSFIENTLITQKELMLLPNPPRFFRENDVIVFPAKISNVSKKALKGKVKLELIDAITLKNVEGILAKNESSEKDFQVDADGNVSVFWELNIPDNAKIITYRITARAGEFFDGEEKAIPVMTNRMLVTESMPLPIRGMQTKTFNFKKLMESSNSSTLKHDKLTLEFTSNPAWYAVQALPYIMEYPYECSEQTFSRFYANSIASHIANSTPKIKAVFDSWSKIPGSEALLSNLEKNQELKSVLLEETPWVLNAQSDQQRKRNVGVLFDLNRMSYELEKAMNKLIDAQTYNGGWPWFKGMPESWYITEHIICGMGHLNHLGITSIREDERVRKMVEKGVSYMDVQIRREFDDLKKWYNEKEMKEDHLSYMAMHYLYARSFFIDIAIPKRTQEAFDYFKGQAIKYWLNKGLYSKGQIALALQRFDEKKTAADIVKSLLEFSQVSEEMGRYWKDNVSGYYWYQAPIETHALMVEVFDEVANDEKAVDDLKVWLLKQKQTQDWKTTKATVEAVYALLLRGGKWLESDRLVEIKLGDMVVDPTKMPDVKVEAGTGYFKTSWSGSDIKSDMGKVTVSKKDSGIAWGALYWQYFEQLDKITPHETPLKLNRKLFIEKNSPSGNVIVPIDEKHKLKVGDKIIVRIEIRVDRAMEYVHMKDMRSSGFEPINVLSVYKYQGGLGYYESTKDASTNFFMDWLPKGTFVFEYPLRVTHSGNFSNGITSIQCMYAPEFTSHSEGIRVNVEKQ